MLAGWLLGLVLLTLVGTRFYALRANTAAGKRAGAIFALATTIAALSLLIAIMKAL